MTNRTFRISPEGKAHKFKEPKGSHPEGLRLHARLKAGSVRLIDLADASGYSYGAVVHAWNCKPNSRNGRFDRGVDFKIAALHDAMDRIESRV